MAHDMNIRLSVILYDEFDPNQMANDILNVVKLRESERPDALIVSIPSKVVESAIQQAVNAGIPVFGCNAGYKD